MAIENADFFVRHPVIYPLMVHATYWQKDTILIASIGDMCLFECNVGKIKDEADLRATIKTFDLFQDLSLAHLVVPQGYSWSARLCRPENVSDEWYNDEQWGNAEDSGYVHPQIKGNELAEISECLLTEWEEEECDPVFSERDGAMAKASLIWTAVLCMLKPEWAPNKSIKPVPTSEFPSMFHGKRQWIFDGEEEGYAGKLFSQPKAPNVAYKVACNYAEGPRDNPTILRQESISDAMAKDVASLYFLNEINAWRLAGAEVIHDPGNDTAYVINGSDRVSRVISITTVNI